MMVNFKRDSKKKMITTLFYVILAILIFTSIYVLVRTIIFQWSAGTVEKIEGSHRG